MTMALRAHINALRWSSTLFKSLVGLLSLLICHGSQTHRSSPTRRPSCYHRRGRFRECQIRLPLVPEVFAPFWRRCYLPAHPRGSQSLTHQLHQPQLHPRRGVESGLEGEGGQGAKTWRGFSGRRSICRAQLCFPKQAGWEGWRGHNQAGRVNGSPSGHNGHERFRSGSKDFAWKCERLRYPSGRRASHSGAESPLEVASSREIWNVLQIDVFMFI